MSSNSIKHPYIPKTEEEISQINLARLQELKDHPKRKLLWENVKPVLLGNRTN